MTEKKRSPKRFIGWALLLALPILLMGIWFSGAVWSNAHPETGEHLPGADFLPPEATDVSFYRSYSWTCYECRIPETVFRRFANPAWVFSEIPPGKPETVIRWNRMRLEKELHERIEKNRSLLTDAGFSAEWKKMEEVSSAVVKCGLVARHRAPNGGGWHVVYDRAAGKAYVRTNPR